MSSFPEVLTDRYLRFKLRHFVANADHYEELATYGQNPDTMVISCSDSRVDPETIFSAMPGELFIVRNVANLVPPYETGGKYHGVSTAIEFAVMNLRIKDLVVLGHSGCGGIKAALDQSAAIQTEAQFISRWMSIIDDARLSVLASHQISPAAVRQEAVEREGRRQAVYQEPSDIPVCARSGRPRTAVAARCAFRHQDRHTHRLEPLARRVLSALDRRPMPSVRW